MIREKNYSESKQEVNSSKSKLKENFPHRNVHMYYGNFGSPKLEPIIQLAGNFGSPKLEPIQSQP